MEARQASLRTAEDGLRQRLEELRQREARCDEVLRREGGLAPLQRAVAEKEAGLRQLQVSVVGNARCRGNRSNRGAT